MDLRKRGGADDDFDTVTRDMLDELDPRPDAELLYLVSDQSLAGMRIEEKLFAAFKRGLCGASRLSVHGRHG